MKNNTVKRIQGYVGMSGLQFHVWRNFIVFGDDNYSLLDNMQLNFITPIADAHAPSDDIRCAATEGAAEMFKTSRGIWSHNSRIYVLSLYIDEQKLREDDSINLRDIGYENCVRIFEILTSPDLIRVGSFKCLMEADPKYSSNFITTDEAERFVSKYWECSHDFAIVDKDPNDLCDADKVYYLDPCYGSLDFISATNAAKAGTALLMDIIDKTCYALPKENLADMKFPATVTCVRQHKSCIVDVADMLSDYTLQDIKTSLQTLSVQQLIINWAISQYAKVAQWYIADVLAADTRYGVISLRDWPVSCDYMNKDAFLAHLEKLSETKK